MTNYLSAGQVLFLLGRLIAQIGGEQGTRELGMLESDVARPRATFGGSDLYPGLCLKAAALLESLLFNHPFIEGDERTAIAAAGLFLQRNGRLLHAGNDDVRDFVIAVLRDHPELDAIALWLRENSGKQAASGL